MGARLAGRSWLMCKHAFAPISYFLLTFSTTRPLLLSLLLTSGSTPGAATTGAPQHSAAAAAAGRCVGWLAESCVVAAHSFYILLVTFFSLPQTTSSYY